MSAEKRALMLKNRGFVAGCALCGACAASKPCTQAAAPKPVIVYACPSATPAPFVPKPVMVWDGEDPGSRAKGWASCQEKADCSASLEAKDGVGRDATRGVEFRAKGKEWMGFGWNWFAWWPDTAGTDVSKFRSLHFWIKVSAPFPSKRPEPESVKLTLHGSAKGGKDASEAVSLNDYARGFADGEWHEVSLPLEPFFRGKGESFDTEKAWELDFGSWNPDERDYTVVLDDIGFL